MLHTTEIAAKLIANRNAEPDQYVPPVTPITKRLWTCTSPWDVFTSPFDGDMVPVLTFARADEACDAVYCHNRAIAEAEAKAKADAEAERIGEEIDRVYDRERDRRAGL